MSVLTKPQLFEKLHSFIGDDTSDEAISFMEDVTDTYNELEQRVNNGDEDWQKRYEENDAAWKARYRHRFFSSSGGNFEESSSEKQEVTPDEIKISDLFKRKEN